ncbi:MAG: hypothetical protein PHZ25_01335 [Candidatus Pacebacteria bacterium]|nr:hypothetical protein [Candidatus Paceibacterota bacterium]
MSKNNLGLAVGFFFAVIHAVWSLAVLLMPVSLGKLINWILVLHHIGFPEITILSFSFMNAVILIIVTLIIGYILGWILGWIIEIISGK